MTRRVNTSSSWRRFSVAYSVRASGERSGGVGRSTRGLRGRASLPGSGGAVPALPGESSPRLVAHRGALQKRGRWMDSQTSKRVHWPSGSDLAEVTGKIVCTQRREHSGRVWPIIPLPRQSLLDLCLQGSQFRLQFFVLL